MNETTSLLPLLRRSWRLLLVGLVLGGLAGNLFARSSAPTYEATVKLLVGPINTDFDTVRAAGELGRTYAELATSHPVVEYGIRQAGLHASATDLLEKGDVRTTSNDITRIVEITVRNGSAAGAAKLANALADRVQTLAKQSPQQFTVAAQTLLQQPEVSRLPSDTQEAIRQAATRVLSPSFAGLVETVDPAEPPRQAVAPRVSLITAVAAVMGAIAMFLLVLVRDSRSAVDERSLRVMTTPAYLGTLSTPNARGGLALDGATAEAADGYRSLATKVGFFAERPPVRTLLVVDTTDGTLAGSAGANMAAVLSDAGRRVVILDTNPERDGATRVLGLDGRPGFGDFLVEWTGGELNGGLDRLSVDKSDLLRVIPNGGGAASTVIDALRAQRVLERLSRDADVVVVTAAPPHRSPAALVWSNVADGTLLVVDDKRTSSERLGDALSSLQHSGASIVGTVIGERPRSGLLRVAR